MQCCSKTPIGRLKFTLGSPGPGVTHQESNVHIRVYNLKGLLHAKLQPYPINTSQVTPFLSGHLTLNTGRRHRKNFTGTGSFHRGSHLVSFSQKNHFALAHYFAWLSLSLSKGCFYPVLKTFVSIIGIGYNNDIQRIVFLSIIFQRFGFLRSVVAEKRLPEVRDEKNLLRIFVSAVYL